MRGDMTEQWPRAKFSPGDKHHVAIFSPGDARAHHSLCLSARQQGRFERGAGARALGPPSRNLDPNRVRHAGAGWRDGGGDAGCFQERPCLPPRQGAARTNWGPNKVLQATGARSLFFVEKYKHSRHQVNAAQKKERGFDLVTSLGVEDRLLSH